jgi:hypothetical protein
MVCEDGKPTNVIVYDHSGNKDYIRKTIRYVSNLIYSPAKIDHQVAISQRSMFIKHTFSSADYIEGSVTPGFAKDYEAAKKMLSTNDFAPARVLIDEMINDHTKNLNERAYAAWLQSMYFYKTQDYFEYLRQSEIAFDLYEYLPLKVASKVSMNLVQAQVFMGYYYEAKETVTKMSGISGLNISEDVEKQFLRDLQSQIDTTNPVIVNGKLTLAGGWLYKNGQTKFSITLKQGVIDLVEVRCIGYHEKYEFNNAVPINIPEDASGCVTLVLGSEGSSFTLTS